MLYAPQDKLVLGRVIYSRKSNIFLLNYPYMDKNIYGIIVIEAPPYRVFMARQNKKEV